jgi:hypothetical protein
LRILGLPDHNGFRSAYRNGTRSSIRRTMAQNGKPGYAPQGLVFFGKFTRDNNAAKNANVST